MKRDVVITSAGVGYSVTVCDTVADGDSVSLWVHTVVREDSITLYGFTDDTARSAFAALLRVTGVGPQAALGVLRDAGLGRLAAAVDAGDPKLLGKVRGVGPKLAARIVTDVALPEGIEQEEGPVSELHELIDTLERLGFGRAACETAARAAKESDPDGDETAWLAGALAELRAS